MVPRKLSVTFVFRISSRATSYSVWTLFGVTVAKNENDIVIANPKQFGIFQIDSSPSSHNFWLKDLKTS